MNSLLEQLDNQEPEELEDINGTSSIIAEMNKDVAFNKED